MRISIIIPVYNAPRVAGSLDSILSQELDVELKLGGGSTDDTPKVLEGYRDRTNVLVN